MSAADKVLADVAAALNRLAESQDRIAAAVEKSAETHETLSKGMNRMTATIQAAQQKIGGEIGPAIDRMKAAEKALAVERREVIEAGRRGVDRGDG